MDISMEEVNYYRVSECALFIDEFSQPKAPPPGQFSGGIMLVGLVPLLTKNLATPSQNARHYNGVHPDDG